MTSMRLGAVLAMVACGACGGCGSSASARPAYVAAANAICTVQLAQLNKLSQPTTAGQAIVYISRAIAIMRRETDQLATLDSVGPKRAEFAAALASTRRLADVLGSFLHQLRSGVVELVAYTQVQTDSRALTAEINAHFRQAGLTRCVA